MGDTTPKTFTQEQVDKIISERLERAKAKYTEEITALTTKLEAADKELKPYKQELRNKHIASLIPDTIDPAKTADAIALAGITEEDGDAVIKDKLLKVTESRP